MLSREQKRWKQRDQPLQIDEQQTWYSLPLLLIFHCKSSSRRTLLQTEVHYTTNNWQWIDETHKYLDFLLL